MKRYTGLLVCIILLSVLLGSCRGEDDEITIAEQYGLAYAPVQIARLNGLVEDRIPGMTVSWKQMGNTASIREAMIAGSVDLGFGAIPPFLIGADNGMDWRIATGISRVPVSLVTLEEDISSLADLTGEHTIALPQPGSVQHILLSMASQELFGDADRFSDQLITISHPDGYHALSSGSITSHFTSPPYLYKELELPSAHEILSGEEAFGGPFTFIIGFASKAFAVERESSYAAVVSALEEACEFITEQPREAARQLAPVYGIDEQLLYEYLTYEGVSYDTGVEGLDRFAEFMYDAGYLDEPLTDPAGLFWSHP